MLEQDNPMNIVVHRLKEREKELHCIYHVEELLDNDALTIEEMLGSLLTVIPMGWQYPGVCEVKICYEDLEVQSEGYLETEWIQHADLVIDNSISGYIKVCYTSLIRLFRGSQFLEEEQKLLQLIAERVSACIFHRKLKTSLDFLKAHAENDKIPADLNPVLKSSGDMHWKWRLRMALSIAEKTNLEKYGITAIYLIGSTKDATARPGSDLDLLVHFHGNDHQKQLLISWMEGWSYALAEYNYAQTGYRSDHMIDLHIITDENVEKPNSYGALIFSSESPARLLKGARPERKS